MLSPSGLMRYYLPFPEAIPHLRTCSHTLLTRPLLVVLLQPFNLHVLGLPPAFVLSQDQTLIFITKAVLCTQFLKLLYFLVSLLTETLQKLTNIIYSYTLSRLHSHALDARLFRLEQPSVHLFFLLIHTLFNISSLQFLLRKKKLIYKIK